MLQRFFALSSYVVLAQFMRQVSSSQRNRRPLLYTFGEVGTQNVIWIPNTI
jgi:hypothetical protein